ncbi:MAG: (E)-4-hydroxy-3-methylbut-2-enyl-diphosphate synthase [Puniceicoccales bacterium]|jgi:(E)-4-hydroxy-3-methylbut-2-enyl-diphosphate synthase|nr:(E)-4-hydroxy-3-methylbut-2-enyl-diphosphate synthase [Puniceicoccales bacterium]
MSKEILNASPAPARHCASRYRALRRATRVVNVGGVAIGGANPIRLQSMTTSNTLDVAGTVRQCVALAEAGCEIIRITAPTVAAAAALGEISARFRADGFSQPLVADIHFLPAAAMEAVEHVEKVRVNPGNFADKKARAAYSDTEYAAALRHLHDTATPLILRAKALGRALRIGTNHGSLSDRIVNRYGDSPLGMVESALEFIRVCESHGFRDIVLSMKSSNPKVMIAAYRLAAIKMAEEGMDYPLHLGVTEAGEGQDGRIKSAIGIGALLMDGLGDTIRVSLTEDPWYEIPVAKDLAARAQALWARNAGTQAKAGPDDGFGSVDPLECLRRETDGGPLILAPGGGEGAPPAISSANPPRVIVPVASPLSDAAGIARELREAHAGQPREVRAEGVLVRVGKAEELRFLKPALEAAAAEAAVLFLEFSGDLTPAAMEPFLPTPAPDGARCPAASAPFVVCRFGSGATPEGYAAWARLAGRLGRLVLDADAGTLDMLAAAVKDTAARHGVAPVLHALSAPESGRHAVGSHRALAEALARHGLNAPLWLRATAANAIDPGAPNDFPARLLEASMFAGTLFCDGLGDALSIETAPLPAKALTLAYNILQGARMRASKTEYVACPSCGRTLFDIQSTTKKIKARTGHLKGVTIGVMGCIVNGPGEMADADFGYVGGAPGKINLYVRRDCVKIGVAQEEAVERLVDLIKEHGRWREPDCA